ncbi:MAG: aspartate aminotransferase family protein [Sedimentibacter sp.]|uniref:aspartate aminotransferase family protein n=1 Tax=Sedimentibacter sp. TaxID=1960295 RepID=UPI00298265B0|nr:aspartate aminotransferase family protein [Sedimentibacter sp.]MDW5299042.1 aspartate aminotransferase family protein [Sedimentibacter sp.]
MNKTNYIEEAEQSLLHTYKRYEIILDKGEGVYLYDTEGKKYLDFAAGIAVFALGYNNKEYNEALKAQLDKLIHTSNYYYNVPAIDAAKKILSATGMERVFFTNSGTESIEGALKLAKKYAYDKSGFSDYEIISMNNSFHGRSLGALSVTGNSEYQKAFKPLIGGIKFADLNDLESVKSQITEKTCAIIIEPVQGEGGIYPATKEFLQGVKSLCEEKDIVLIFDEVQCGMGRTGSMFAYQNYGVMPDVLALAKALGCGVPVGAFLANKKMESAMIPGDHGTTYGGNPLVCTAVSKVLDLFESNNIVEHVNEIAPYLENQLDKLVDEYDFIIERRGKGLMQGIVFSVPVTNIILKAQENGLIIITAGKNVVRIVPPLIITKEHVDEMIVKFKAAIDATVISK